MTEISKTSNCLSLPDRGSVIRPKEDPHRVGGVILSLEESPNLSSIGQDVSSVLEPQYRIKILSITVAPGDA